MTADLPDVPDAARALKLVNADVPLADFSTASTVYQDKYFGRDLDPGEEIDDALAESSVMQSSAVGIMNAWVATLQNAHVESRNLTEEAELATDLMADGAMILRSLRPSVAYAIHLERQCSRLLEASLLLRRKYDASADATQTVEAIATAIESDVRMFEGRVSVLLMRQQSAMMGIQTDLSARVTGLTRVTTILTVIILLATLFAGIVAGISAL